MSVRIPAYSFPRHRPQMYAPSVAGLLRVHRYYAFGRPIPALARVALAAVLAVPGLRRLVSGRHDLELPFDAVTLERILDRIGDSVEQRTWAVFSSSWHSRRIIVFSFDRRSLCSGVTHVTPVDESAFHPRTTGNALNVPRLLAETEVGEWSLATVESLPPWNRPHPWDPEALATILEDVRSIVEQEIPSSPGEDLVASHGDLTPWNLRLDSAGRSWLFDWEWAGWAPRQSDLLRFAITHRSLSTTDARALATWVSGQIPADGLAQAARYWLGHRIYRDADRLLSQEGDPTLGAERRQGQVEADALRILAGD